MLLFVQVFCFSCILFEVLYHWCILKSMMCSKRVSMLFENTCCTSGTLPLTSARQVVTCDITNAYFILVEDENEGCGMIFLSSLSIFSGPTALSATQYLKAYWRAFHCKDKLLLRFREKALS